MDLWPKIHTVRWPFQWNRPRELDAQLLGRLRPFVAPTSVLPRAIAKGAPEIFPGVVVVVAALGGTQVDFVKNPSGSQLQVAVQNLRNLPLPPHQVFKTEDFQIALFEAQDEFVAARVTLLDELAETAAPRWPRKDGVMVGIPRRRTVLLHVLGKGDPDRARDALAIATSSLYQQTPHSKLSPHVYWVEPDGHAQVVA